MKNLTMFTALFLPILLFCSFTFFTQDKMKIIRYTKTNNGFLVIEYSEGKIKKQIKRNQIMTYNLPFSDKNEIENEISKLEISELVNHIDSIAATKNTLGIANMYMFIQGNDTVKTRFFSKEQTPLALKRLDFLLYKNRK